MIVGELFAGIGGFGLAAQRAGAQVQWASEIDPFALKVYKERFPSVEQLGDATKIKWAPVFDCLTAGFPCQDLSVAGKRKGLAGARSGLFWEIVRIVKKQSPTWLLLENVPGLLSSNGGKDFEAILQALDKLGYGVAWRVLDAQYFGVPQRRRRVFIVGYLGRPCPPEILFDSEGLSGHTAPSRQAGANITQSITSRLGSSGADDNAAQGKLLVAATLNSGGNDGGFRTEPGEHIVARPVTATSYKRHDEDTDTIVPNGPRRLTPRECERLQGFPDDWTLVEKASDSARYKVLGNAVAVPVAEWILKRMVAYEKTS